MIFSAPKPYVKREDVTYFEGEVTVDPRTEPSIREISFLGQSAQDPDKSSPNFFSASLPSEIPIDGLLSCLEQVRETQRKQDANELGRGLMLLEKHPLMVELQSQLQALSRPDLPEARTILATQEPGTESNQRALLKLDQSGFFVARSATTRQPTPYGRLRTESNVPPGFVARLGDRKIDHTNLLPFLKNGADFERITHILAKLVASELGQTETSVAAHQNSLIQELQHDRVASHLLGTVTS